MTMDLFKLQGWLGGRHLWTIDKINTLGTIIAT